jgi:hypothetical protein
MTFFTPHHLQNRRQILFPTHPHTLPILLAMVGVLTAFEIYPLMLKLFGNSSRLLLRPNSPFSILGGHASKDA